MESRDGDGYVSSQCLRAVCDRQFLILCQLFLVEGVATVGLAAIFALILPNSNKKILGLSKIECDWVQWNYAVDLGQSDDSREITPMQGLVMAVKDIKTWLFFGVLYCVSLAPPSSSSIQPQGNLLTTASQHRLTSLAPSPTSSPASSAAWATAAT